MLHKKIGDGSCCERRCGCHGDIIELVVLKGCFGVIYTVYIGILHSKGMWAEGNDVFFCLEDLKCRGEQEQELFRWCSFLFCCRGASSIYTHTHMCLQAITSPAAPAAAGFFPTPADHTLPAYPVVLFLGESVSLRLG